MYILILTFTIESSRMKNKDEINILVDIFASAIGVFTNPTKITNTFVTERHSNYTHKTISAHTDLFRIPSKKS